MGKMSRLNTKLPNGDVGRDCEVEDWCGEPAYQLSWSDRPYGNPYINNGIATYKRTMRYKCANGHRFDKKYTVEKDLLKPNNRNRSFK